MKVLSGAETRPRAVNEAVRKLQELLTLVPVDSGGTGIASYTIGDILYASAATVLSKLAGVATGNALISGGVGTAPAWGKVGLTTHVSGTLPIANGGTNGTDAATAFSNLKQAATDSATGVVEKATAGEVRSAAADKYVSADLIESASALVALTDDTTVAVDWDAGINFSLTLTTNRILGNPTNEQPGTWRTVYVISDGGPDTLTFGSEYGGAPPTLADITTTKAYLLMIFCRATSQFVVSAIDASPA